MKRTGILFLAATVSLVLLAAPTAWADEAGSQPVKSAPPQDGAAEQLSAEDREVVQHMEMLKNLRLYEGAEMDLLLSLDVLTANE